VRTVILQVCNACVNGARLAGVVVSGERTPPGADRVRVGATVHGARLRGRDTQHGEQQREDAQASQLSIHGASSEGWVTPSTRAHHAI
jgi:hypothetical protein